VSFANPAGWWLATLVIPIIALHILKAQRTQVEVASTLEWESIDRPVAAARPWQRLRWSIPLLLQLLAVALLAAALAGPALNTGRTSAEHVVIMVDTSSSMGGTDGSPTRVDEARGQVSKVVDGLGATTRVSLISTGAPAQILAGETPATDIGGRLDAIRASEGGFDAAATGSLATSLERPDQSVEHVLISDGGLDDSAIRQLPAGTRLVGVGRSDVNVGVTNVVVTPRGASLHVQATLTNSGDRDATRVARFDVDGRTRGTTSTKVTKRGSVETALDVPVGKRIEVLLDGDDVLRLDDHAYAAGPSESSLDVLVVGAANPFVDALLSSNPQVKATRTSPEKFAAATAAAGADPKAGGPLAGIDLAVFDQAPVPANIAVPYLAIAPPGGTQAVRVGDTVEDPVPTLIRSDVDLLADLDLRGLAFASAQRIDAPAASTLIAAEGAPLLVQGRDANVGFVYLAAPLSQTNLGLLPAFPVLGDRVIATLGRTDLVGGDLHVGDALNLAVGADAAVTSPSGSETTVRPGNPAPMVDRTGFWTVRTEDQGERTVVVNADPVETQVAPTDQLAIPGIRGDRGGEGEPVTKSLVGALILTALLVIAVEWLIGRRRRGVPQRQWRRSEYLRIAIVVLLLAALWAPSFHRSSDAVATVFVVDTSDSLAASRDDVVGTVREALAKQPSGSVAGVVVVGAQARVDAAVKADLAWGAPRTEVDGSATDLASGLRVAGAMAPPDHARRIVVISDGRQTTGEDLGIETARLKRAEVAVDSVEIDPAFGADVSVVSVDVPSRARATDQLTIDVNVNVTVAQQANVTLLRDGKEVDSKLSDLSAGNSLVSFTQPAGDEANIEWTARVAGPNNGVFENDESRASTRVEGRPSVLLVEGSPGGANTLAAALNAAGTATKVTSPEQLGGLSDLAGVDAVVLVNVAAKRLSSEQTDAISSSVRQLGTGLLVMGGTSSYGAGDYLGSRLEELLPVTSEAKDPKRRSKVAQVFAVDVSGSMGACHCADDADGSNSRLEGGVTKTDIARDSAVRSLEAFKPEDEVGVLALDDRQRWLLDLGPVGDGTKAKKQMNDITHSEQLTNLDPSLTMSAERLRNSDASLRHIVLFTDGFTDTTKLRALAAQAKQLRDEGITVSVMGTGEGAAEALRGIADAGGGRYYAGRDLKELPDLLLEETKVVARRLIVEGNFLPEISSNAPVVANLTSAPPISGYLATTPRPSATQHLRIGDEKDPLLATWRVGLGQVSSWTSDSGERWSSAWKGWDGSSRFYSDVIRAILPAPAGSAQMRFDGASATIEAAFDEPVPDGATVTAQVVDPAGKEQAVTMVRNDDRTFTGTAETGAAGTYGVGVTAAANGTTNGKSDAAISTTAELGYSREYLSQGADTETLKSLSTQTGGRGLIRATQAFDADGLTPGNHRVDLRRRLLLAAALLWPMTIAMSRLRRSGAATVVESLRQRTGLDEVTSFITARRAKGAVPPAATANPGPPRPDPMSPGAPAKSPPPAAPSDRAVAPPRPEAKPKAPKPQAGSGSDSTLDSLLAAKRRRRDHN
jgi:Mg-chelatase subunit ChlD